MCFSAEADLVAGLVVGAIGVDAWRHVRRPAEAPLAVLPVVLGTHQLIEAVVWVGLENRVSWAPWYPALLLYLTIAFGVLPVLVPLAVGALEPLRTRRSAVAFTVVGAIVSGVLVSSLLRGPVGASVQGRHIAYQVDIPYSKAVVGLYVLATCGALLLSRHPHIRRFGAVNLVAVCLLAWLNQSGFVSLWCAWAAVASIAIAWHLRAVQDPLSTASSSRCAEVQKPNPGPSALLGDSRRQQPGRQGVVIMQASVGDRIVVLATHVGGPNRDGEVLEVRGDNGAPPYVVRWSDNGHEALYFPESDAVVHHAQ